MAKNETVISVEHVSKDFKLPHQKVGSIKSGFTNIFSLHKREYEMQHALRDIDFTVQKGEFLGIVGRNGSGKSTLLKLLAGIYQPSKGKVHVKGRIVPFIELGVGFNGDLSGRDNVYLNGAMLGFSEKEIDAKYQDIVDFAELERFMDQKLKNYSSGMQVRLAFSVATRLAESDILLIDEVLAVGDANFQRKCFEYFKSLKKEGKTVIFVTHDMNAVREYCDRAILIEKNEIKASGSASDIATKYTRLFIDRVDSGPESKEDLKRWGDGAVRFTRIDAPKKLIDKDELVFTFHLKAEQDVKNPNVGFLIKNAAHAHILGTNTKICQKKIQDLKKGDEVAVEWRLPNVFNDGIHYIDPAIVYKGDLQVADWWEEAVRFIVLKQERTPYLVNPPVSCSVKEAG